ncbi:hypothetical protein VN97_g9912 [Penicillium thymicola]|uniref:Uncharacterized protein n=1 Tax=Penicillium thymicola TaxID=293382 RepID=A0AAI9T9Z1_PENTH|nr:hypothetical protein VN97_g9912 [Penicillium thymicola]
MILPLHSPYCSTIHYNSWDQYQIRHEWHRGELALGIERPISRSLPGINDLKVPDFYWHRFWKTQPERVWESEDMNFLKEMLQDYDMNFKELDYLHIPLLHGLVSQKRALELDQSLLGVAGEMLSIPVEEAIILRDRLVNSGTSLISKVYHTQPLSALRLSYLEYIS